MKPTLFLFVALSLAGVRAAAVPRFQGLTHNVCDDKVARRGNVGEVSSQTSRSDIYTTFPPVLQVRADDETAIEEEENKTAIERKKTKAKEEKKKKSIEERKKKAALVSQQWYASLPPERKSKRNAEARTRYNNQSEEKKRVLSVKRATKNKEQKAALLSTTQPSTSQADPAFQQNQFQNVDHAGPSPGQPAANEMDLELRLAPPGGKNIDFTPPP
jgi:hypothetical protein